MVQTLIDGGVREAFEKEMNTVHVANIKCKQLHNEKIERYYFKLVFAPNVQHWACPQGHLVMLLIVTLHSFLVE